MKLVGVRQAQVQLSGLLAASQKEGILLTRRGLPVAVLTGVEGRELEDVLLAFDPAFWRLIERRRRYSGPMLSHEEVVAELTRPEPAAARARPKRRRRRAASRRT